MDAINFMDDVQETPAEWKAAREGNWSEVADDEKILIFARSYRDASTFAYKYNLPKKQWRFVNDANDLRGYTDCVLLRISTWTFHPDAKYINDAIEVYVLHKRMRVYDIVW